MLSTGQEMVQENQGRGIVSEFYVESGKAKILKKARNEKYTFFKVRKYFKFIKKDECKERLEAAAVM